MYAFYADVCCAVIGTHEKETRLFDKKHGMCKISSTRTNANCVFQL